MNRISLVDGDLLEEVCAGIDYQWYTGQERVGVPDKLCGSFHGRQHAGVQAPAEPAHQLDQFATEGC